MNFLLIRGAYADKFWFTLFHEIAHILNGDVENRKQFIDYDFIVSEQENRANDFAGNVLIDPYNYKRFILEGNFSMPAITLFAKEEGVFQGIVIGRLQKEGYLPHNRLNHHKMKYTWK